MGTHLRLDISTPALYPEVVQLLRTLPPDLLFHSTYPFRHPAAIYGLSLRQLASDFKRLLADYSASRTSMRRSAELAEQIAQSQRILIYSLREHLDDCQMILMCFVDPTSLHLKGRSPDEVLKAGNLKEQKLFWEGVHNYADSYLMPFVNALKHSQGRFRTVTFECSAVDVRPGFYLEEVDNNGVAQPAIKQHGGNSAFSYARDLRSNLAFVFRAAESLQTAVEAILKRYGKAPSGTPEGAEPDSNLWTEVCKQVAELDKGVFPQELKQRFVRFSLQPEGGLRIRELDRDTTLSFPRGNIRCTTLTSGDGMTKTYRMPYCGDNKPKLK